jgi:DNA-binding transcriptional regulator GbsR (MarR family)
MARLSISKEALMTPPPFDSSDDYEEISSVEVDRVVQALEELMQSITSENIRAYLDEAADNVYSLIYDVDGQPHDTLDTESDDFRDAA